jgi:hypothetical protein
MCLLSVPFLRGMSLSLMSHLKNVTPQRPLLTAKEAGKFSVLAGCFTSWNKIGISLVRGKDGGQSQLHDCTILVIHFCISGPIF